MEKTAKTGGEKWQPCPVAAHPKLTYRRETRLLALLVFGEPLECACRAIGISSTAIRKRMARDVVFAERVRAAREHRAVPALATAYDWRAVAAQLEAEHPDRWALAMPWDD